MKSISGNLFAALGFVTCLGYAGALDLTVSSSGGNATASTLYGLLIEDVYHSIDGGIYGEMIQNRAMQGVGLNGNEPNRNLAKWHNWAGCTLEMDQSTPLLSSALPNQMAVAVSANTGTTGMWNEGFAGFNVTTATRYAASFVLRGDFKGTITGAFWSNTTNGQLGSTSFAVSQTASQGWVHYAQTFTVSQSAPDHKNTFHLTFDAATDGKLRMDLANAVNNLGGKFLRLPGGNNMEGNAPPYRWSWRATTGPIETRPGRPGTWGYYNTDGLGLLEMMDWCTEMNLEPLLAVWGGYYLNGNFIQEADLQPYVNDVLDELEFLMGPTSSTFGALRASLGHPDPFSIKWVEIGNEDFFDGSKSYQNYRFNIFYAAIHARYPQITVISSLCINQDLPGGTCGPNSSLNNPPAGVATDLHLYQSSDATVGLFHAFDHISRAYPIIIGEYAAIYPNNDGGNQLDNPTLQSATAEAVMFLGLERNSDIVFGVCHGALIKSLNDEPNNVALLKHNADTIVPSYSYYVAQIFGHNFGDHTAPTTSDSGFGPLYWSSTIGPTGTHFVKVVNYKGAASTPVTVRIAGSNASSAKLITLSGPGESSTNLLGATTSSVTEKTVQGSGGVFSFTLTGAYAIAVLVV